MNWLEEENRVKLHLLQSLARSQRALARMMESMADVTEHSEGTSRTLVSQIDAISRYQREIAVKFAGLRVRKLRKSRPGKPWLQEGLSIPPITRH